jgi:hypothetical protein
MCFTSYGSKDATLATVIQPTALGLGKFWPIVIADPFWCPSSDWPLRGRLSD